VVIVTRTGPLLDYQIGQLVGDPPVGIAGRPLANLVQGIHPRRQERECPGQAMPLDPDDRHRRMYKVPNALRAAILTKKFRAGDKLPSRNELAKTYDVAPMTVQNALRELREEGLIVSRQGSGVFVRERTERPVGLRPHIERAFDTQR